MRRARYVFAAAYAIFAADADASRHADAMPVSHKILPLRYMLHTPFRAMPCCLRRLIRRFRHATPLLPLMLNIFAMMMR